MKDKFSPEKEGLITAIPPPRYMLGEDAGISSKKKSWMDKLGLLIVVPLFAVLAVLAFRTTHVSVDIFIPFGRNSHSRHTFGPGQCSGHGVQIQKSCICDLGFSGSDCSQKVPYDIPAQPNSPSAEKSVALFLREFGNSSPNAESNVNVAKTLMKSGFKVTVVTVGSQEVQSIEGISVAKVESENIDYGSSVTVSNSMAVYEYLQNYFYDVVYFDASTGYGYYTLLAQKQGLRCYSSKFIVGVNSFSDSLMEQINSGLDEPVTDVELLKQDFMRQKSIELADSVVFTGESLVRELDDPSKIVQKSKILNPISNNSVKPVRSSQIPKELVYVGDFNIASGLVLFCDALDNLHSIVSTSDIVVTFYGKSSSVGSIASDEYIKKRVAAWTKFKVNVNDKKADMKETVEYFTNSAVARLAVIPSSVTPNAVMTQELVLAGVQFVAARTPENEGLMTKESVEKVLFEIEDSYELSLRLLQALKLGGAYATSTVKDSGADWSKLFSKAADSEVTCQGEQTDKPFVSIVMTHSSGVGLETLKKSIASLESQTYGEYEVILVTDGETGEADAFLRNLAWQWWEEKGWKVLREPRRNVVEAKNIGANHAVGKYIFFMDETAYAKPHELETLVRVAEKNNAGAVTAGHDVMGHGAKVRRSIPVGDSKMAGLFENVYGSAVLVKREVFQEVGGLNDASAEHACYEFLTKLSLKGHHVESVAEPLQWQQTEIPAVTETVKDTLLKHFLRHNDVANLPQRKLVQHLSRKRGITADDEVFAAAVMFTGTMTGTFSETFTQTFTQTSTPTATEDVLLSVNAPTEIPNCDSDPFVIDLTGSFGVAPLVFTFETRSNNTKFSSALRDINEIDAGLYEINSTVFDVGQVETFTITLFDAQGVSSSVTRNITKVADEIPIVSIDAGSTIYITKGQPLELNALASMSTCFSGSASFSYQWFLSNSSGVNSLPQNVNASTAALSVPAYTLAYGNYDVSVVVTVNGKSSVAAATLVVSASPVFVWVQEGSEVKVGNSQDVSLTAGGYDPDDINGGSFIFSWTCSSSSQGCFNPVASANSVSINEKSSPSLVAGSVYTITLTGKTQNRSDNATIKVNAVSGELPTVKIYRYPESNVVGSNQPLHLIADAMFAGQLVDSDVAEWTWTETTNSVDMTGIDTESSILAIPENTLQAGKTYTFKVTVNVQNLLAFAKVDVVVGSAPSKGFVSVVNPTVSERQNGDAASGYHIVSQFQLTTGNWTGSRPLSYSFGYIDVDEYEVPFTVMSSQTSLSGIRLSSDVKFVFVEATDINGLSATITKSVNIEKKTMTNAEKSNLANSLVTGLSRASTASELLLAVDSILQFTDFDESDTSLSTEAKQALLDAQARALAVLESFVDNLDAIDQGFATKSISIIANTGVGTANATTIEKSLDTLQKMINGAGSSTKSMDSSTARQVAKFLDNVLNRGLGSSLKKRAASTGTVGTRVRGAVNDMAREIISADKCTVSGPAQTVTGSRFAVQSRKIVASSNRNGDSRRSLAGFNISMPSIPAGCYDVAYTVWNTTSDQKTQNNITSNILTIKIYNSGANTGPSVSGNYEFNTTVSSGSFAGAGNPQCVGSDGSSWSSSGCTTTQQNGNVVECKCSATYGEYAVQMRATTATPTATPTPTPPPGGPASNIGPIVGGAVAGVVVLGGGLGFMRYRQRRRG